MAEAKEIVIKERYQVKEKIKAELTGTIYNGFDSRAKKTVQIKRYDPKLLNLALVEKLQEAVYRLAVLKHTALLVPKDSALAMKNFFTIQEPLDKEETIADILDKLKSFTLDSGLYIVKQIAQAVSYLHQKKITHGNITPANICILKDGNIKIKNMLLDAMIQYNNLKKSQILSDPAFLAPEQLQGRPTSPQSDIWALGTLMYKLFTGKTPYKESKEKEQMLRNYTANPIKPTLQNPKIPKYIEDVILKALQKDPKLRQSSMLEFLSQLESKKVSIKLADLELKKKMEEQEKQKQQAAQNKPAPPSPVPNKQPLPKKPAPIKAVQPKPNIFNSLFHRTKKITSPELQKRIKNIPQQIPTRVKTMADKFDRLVEEKKQQKPLFSRPKTFMQKVVFYGITVLAIGLIIALGQSLMIGYFTSIPEIKVPDLTGLPLEEAQDLLEEQGLKGKVVSELINSAVPMDHIISQKPDPTRVVKKDRIIKLYVSKGVGEAKVPELVGRAFDQAKAILARNGLGLEATKHVYNTEVQRNFILKQNPEPEVIVQKSTTVNVVVSSGFPTALKLKDKSPDTCVVEAMLFVPDKWAAQKIKLILSDSRGSRTVFDQKVMPGQRKRIQLISEDTALVEVFYNDELALKQSFLELGDLIKEKEK